MQSGHAKVTRYAIPTEVVVLCLVCYLGTLIREKIAQNGPEACAWYNFKELSFSSKGESRGKLGTPIAGTVEINQCTSDRETEDEFDVIDGLLNKKLNVNIGLADVGELNVTEKSTDNIDLNIIIQDEKNSESRINRIKRTNDICETVQEGQKRQAHELLQNTTKPQKLANLSVCDNVVICSSATDVDRGPTDARNVLVVFVEIKHEKFKLGTEQRVPFCLL
ncbi:unnamed protein product [Rotaria socialis]|uniref:Uncharacterized protein n=1 Tax=Rotaria socialis TaxID=392032 RepID=A0A821BZH7_9BILA|nr:unnamed protein product [Rotaria socialis]